MIGETPRFSVLEIPPTVAPRRRRMKLRVASTVPANLRVAGKRFPVGRRARTVRVRIRRGDEPVSLKLVLAAGRQRTTLPLTIPRR